MFDVVCAVRRYSARFITHASLQHPGVIRSFGCGQRVAISLMVVLLWASSPPTYAQDPVEQLPGSDANIAGVFSQVGNVSGRSAISDGQEIIDTFSGILQLQYTDAVIPGDGGFDLPIIRTSLEHPLRQNKNEF